MNRALLFVFLLLPFMAKGQGDLGFYFQDVVVIPTDFELVSKNFNLEKKGCLHALRNYIEAKETLLIETEKKIRIVESDIYINIIDTVTGQRYLNLIDSSSRSNVINDDIKHYLGDMGYMPQFYGNVKISELDVITEKVRKKVNDVKKDHAIVRILHTSEKNLEDDINRAQLQIDELYGKLYDDGRFKLWITGIFSFIVAALLLTFFVFISRKSETNLAKDFLSSGNGLQFITLFSLVIAIILFGVLGILEGRELAAILSGISGYILGKGIQNPKDLGKNNKKEQQQDPPAAEVKEG